MAARGRPGSRVHLEASNTLGIQMPMSSRASVEGTLNPLADKVVAVRSRKRSSALVAAHGWDMDRTDLAYLETTEMLEQSRSRLVGAVPTAFVVRLNHAVGGPERLMGRYCWFFDC